MLIKITPNETGNPPGKLADAELIFADGEPLAGLKLIGFSVWESRGSEKRRNVTFPARQYSINGERRSFALLRPRVDVDAQSTLREQILDAYARWMDADDTSKADAIVSKDVAAGNVKPYETPATDHNGRTVGDTTAPNDDPTF